MPTYEGIKGPSLNFEVTKDEQTLDPRPSQKLWNHSPDGFSWGYGGSSPSQLALALLLDVTQDEALSMKLYQLYKREVVAEMNINFGWLLTTFQIEHWIRMKGHTISTP